MQELRPPNLFLFKTIIKDAAVCPPWPSSAYLRSLSADQALQKNGIPWLVPC